MTEPTAGLEAIADRVELTAPAIEASLELAHVLFEHLWTQHPEVTMPCRVRMETAALEVMGNIVEHAYAHDRTPASETTDPAVAGNRRRLQLVLGVEPGVVLVSFSDNGMPASIDLSQVVMPGEEAESGRGLAMAKASVDEITYRSEAGRNHWNLRCVDR